MHDVKAVLVIDDEQSVGTLLKGLDQYRETPIVMISSRSDSVTRERARRAGAVEYLVKPFTFGELLHRIQELLSRPYFG